jgi:hypothetical protein
MSVDQTFIRVIITALLETSDHTGYCSDNECKYNCCYVQHICEIKCGRNKIDENSLYFEVEYADVNLMPLPDVSSGTGYCHLSDQCIDACLDKHDYRYTIKTIEIVK